MFDYERIDIVWQQVAGAIENARRTVYYDAYNYALSQGATEQQARDYAEDEEKHFEPPIV